VPEPARPAAGPPDAAPQPDAGGAEPDAGRAARPGAGRADPARVQPDAGPEQEGTQPDAGPEQEGTQPDAGPEQEGTQPDAGPEQEGAQPDAGPEQAGAMSGRPGAGRKELTDAKLAELEDRWLRAVADLDNVRKRMARDIERLRAEERARVAAQWLPVLDNLELALAHAAGDAAIADGVRAVRDQAVGVLARLGYDRHAETGVPFDPARHEALATADRDDVEPGTVVEVLRPGYGEGERQLRPATVVVARKAV